MSFFETASWRPLQMQLYPARVNFKLGQRCLGLPVAAPILE